MAAPPTPAHARLDYIDGLRALAALVVYVNHAYAQVSSGDHVQLRGLAQLARSSMVAGHLSVTVFIVISGFCLTLPVVQRGGELRGGTLGFLKRRARRILPPYYAAVALCLILIWTVIGTPTGSLWDFPLEVDRVAIVSHLLLVQDLFATSRINYVFWSIAVEWQIYFLVPLLLWCWRRFGPSRVVPGALLIGYALRFGFGDTRLARAHPQFIGMFALGMLSAYLVRSAAPGYVALRERVPWSGVGGIALLTVLGLAAYWGVPASESRFHLLDLPVGVATAAALVAAASARSNALGRVTSLPPLVFLGTFSYSLYLIHAPLLQIMWQYLLVPLQLSRELMLLLLLSGGLGVVVGASYLFFRLFEAPFIGSPEQRTALKPAPSQIVVP